MTHTQKKDYINRVKTLIEEMKNELQKRKENCLNDFLTAIQDLESEKMEFREKTAFDYFKNFFYYYKEKIFSENEFLEALDNVLLRVKYMENAQINHK